MKCALWLASIPLAIAQPVLPPGTAGEVRLVAQPVPMRVYRNMTGLGANDAGLWNLIARNTTGKAVTVTLDDWRLACPGLSLLDSAEAGALLGRDTARSKPAVVYQLLELASIGVAAAVSPYAALAVPLLSKLEGISQAAIPNVGPLLGAMKESIKVEPGETGHTLALAGKMRAARSCGGWK